MQSPASRNSRPVNASNADERGNCLREMSEIRQFCQHGEQGAFNDVQLRHEGIWLHALRYTDGESFDYSVSLPAWAYNDFH